MNMNHNIISNNNCNDNHDNDSSNHCMMSCDNAMVSSCDCGPMPHVLNISKATMHNHNFRTVLWTGCKLQLTVMCIPSCGEIGMEMHCDTDQFLRVEQGCGIVKMGECKEHMDFEKCILPGDAILIPAGTWHNVINTTCCPLKIYSIYAPPHHPHGAVHKTREDAEHSHDNCHNHKH